MSLSPWAVFYPCVALVLWSFFAGPGSDILSAVLCAVSEAGQGEEHLFILQVHGLPCPKRGEEKIIIKQSIL